MFIFDIIQLFDMFHVLQIAQEGQHFGIRCRHAGVYKNHHSDARYVRDNQQWVIKGLRKRFDNNDIPTLHIPKKGHLGIRDVSQSLFSPDELVRESWALRDPQYDEAMSTIIQAQCRKLGTRDKQLRRDLESQMMGHNLSVNTVKDIVKWMIQNSPGRDIYGNLGLYFYGRESFENVRHELPVYMNPMDKAVGKVSFVSVAFHVVSVQIYICLRTWVGLPKKDFPISVGPYYGELHTISFMDSSI